MLLDTWVVVADSANARLFATARENTPLREFKSLLHSSARLHEHDLVSDRAGRTQDSHAPGRHQMEPRTHAKDHEALNFAQEIAAELEQGRTHNQLEHIILIAPPRFLGLLRGKLDKQTADLVVLQLDKDLVKHDPEAIRAQLPLLLY